MNANTQNQETEKSPRLDTYFWAITLILAGVLFGADSLGILPQLGSASVWSWIFLGAGVVGLALGLYAFSSPKYAQPTTWDWVFSGLLIVIGLTGFFGLSIPLWLILIVVGIAILANALARRD